jgi:vacuolar-type H+-ATPase subunit H
MCLLPKVCHVMLDGPGDLQAMLAVGGIAVTGLTVAFGYINSRISGIEKALTTASDNARKELASATGRTEARQDKIWEALKEQRDQTDRYQTSAMSDRNAMAQVMATKADLHREVDRLAILLTRPLPSHAATPE